MSSTAPTFTQPIEQDFATLQKARADGQLSDADWNAAVSRKMQSDGIAGTHQTMLHGRPEDRARIAHEMSDRVERDMGRSLSEAPVPSSPYAYTLRQSWAPTESEHELEGEFREAAYEGRMPASIAQGLWEEMCRAASEHLAAEDSDDSESLSRLKAKHEKAARDFEGEHYDQTTQLLSALRSELQRTAPRAHEFLMRDQTLLAHPGVRSYLRRWAMFRRGGR